MIYKNVTLHDIMIVSSNWETHYYNNYSYNTVQVCK